MFRVLTCLSGEHDWRLVLLAGLVCFVASIAAVNIFHRAIASQARTRLIWIAIAGAAIGYGIWATHFIAMLAYEPGVPTGYGITLTALSLAVAMMLTSCGLGLAASDSSGWRAPVGGAVIGAGIASMHYLGMWALEVPGHVVWSMDLVAASIVLGMLFGYAALSVAVRHQDRWMSLVAALLLTLAIVTHHFTAMGAVEIVPDPLQTPAALSLSPAFLAVVIAGVALSVLGMSLVGVLADRRLALRTRRFEDIISQLSLARQQVEASQKELEQQRFRLDTAINHMGEGLCMFDAAKRLVVCNDRYAKMYRLPPELLLPGTAHREIIKHRIANGILKGETTDSAATEKLATLNALPADEISSRVDELADGRLICVTRQPMPGGGWVATHRDVTEQRRSEAKITHMAQHDALTDLPNRVLLKEWMEQALSGARCGGPSLAVLMLDLDRFKDVNDTLGHPAGDALLKSVAARLRRCVSDTTLVARLGGDEFAVIDYVSDPVAEAGLLAEKIRKALSEPIDLGHHRLTTTTSIGIAIAPRDGTDSDEVLRSADLALYSAKSVGRGSFRFFEPELDRLLQARRSLERDMRSALANGEFELRYQPFIHVASGETCGFEALLRWHHPKRGLVPPDQFIPIAEEIGLIGPLGEWVLGRACEQAVTWPSEMKLAVNVSAVQFRDPDFTDVVVNALAASKLSPRRLELEITESVFLVNSSETLATLHKLKAQGVRIALDDFGTGYSSLSYLRSFPFDKLKIDKSFVRDATATHGSKSIVRAVISLGRSLGMTTIAEGIETVEQLDHMRAEGCNEAQGFLFSHPVPVTEIAAKILELRSGFKPAAVKKAMAS
ncbi:MAG TPA: bifunctional diguanylate cyclase/phosphodiesterase [Bradyrhizobium sp.]|nr:bifunctional diguanylate cyclase/phosphodiesterase [Bradyrhizobium sp.]